MERGGGLGPPLFSPFYCFFLFLPFKELHKLEEIMSALKQAEQIKHWSRGGGAKVCECVREPAGIVGRSEVITNRAREAARGSKLSGGA